MKKIIIYRNFHGSNSRGGPDWYYNSTKMNHAQKIVSTNGHDYVMNRWMT